jgi:hypothetical protein
MLEVETIQNTFSNVSDDPKWIIDEFRDLVQIPLTQIPMDHHPTTGESLGVLCEPPSTNFYPYAMGMSNGLTNSNGVSLVETVGANNMLFFPKALRFDGSVAEKSTSFSFDTPKSWFYVGISFFMKFPDGGTKPTYGRSYFNGTDFHFMINGLEVIEASGEVRIDELVDGSYWVRARIKSPSRPVNEITIGNSKWQSNRTFLITGLQIEPYMVTSPILTNGEVEVRSGNHLRFNGDYFKTVNPEQGTLEVSYSLKHGSVGSIITASSVYDDWEIGHIGEWYDNPEKEPMTYVIDVTNDAYSFSNFDDPTIDSLRRWNETNKIKFTYSAYGNRFIKNDSLIYKHKNFNSNKNNMPPTVYSLGISRNGTHINGYIESFDIRGRALTDKEMVNG